MTVVWKYVLSLAVEQHVQMPRDAEILSVQLQHGRITMWVRCLPDEKDTVFRQILMSGTGQLDAPDFDYEHIGTVQTPDGYVWHLFAGRED